MSAVQVRRMMRTSNRMLRKLQARRMFPRPQSDGSYDMRQVEKALRLHPWMRLLAVPLTERELTRIDRRLRIPMGMGFDWLGLRFARLDHVLDAAWA